MADVEVAIDFAQQFSTVYGDNFIAFHTASLKDVVNEICLGPIKSRKIIALYFHNEHDPFSKMFCPLLGTDSEVARMLESASYYFVGWTVTREAHHEHLRRVLDECVDFEPAQRLITEKRAALLVVYPMEGSVTVFSILHGPKVKPKDVLVVLREIENNFRIETQIEEDLESVKENARTKNCIGSREFQRLMCERLGDRDYDRFEHDEHEYLREKIAFSKYGPPTTTAGYDKAQKKAVEETYSKIREFGNKYAEWKDQIAVSFVYNCLEPRAEEKLARSKKYADYNPNDDLLPVALYVLRKCRGSSNPCRMFVDNDNRIYGSWRVYLEDNKLHKCMMVVPERGRYVLAEEGPALLERHLSPSCGIRHVVLKGTDIASTVVGLTSGGIAIAALIPTVVIAPAALTVAAVTGIGVGIYSVIRNAANIYDRRVHAESLSFANSEARGAYLNIIAGTLGFVGAGATTAVAELAAKGVDIGQGAQVAFSTVRLMNMSASGISAFNSTYTVVDGWLKEQQELSPITVAQMKSSILFFENVVADSTVNQFQNSSRNRRSWKSSSDRSVLRIRKVVDRRHIFDTLDLNSEILNDQNIRVTLEDDVIKLNGVPVEVDTFLGERRQADVSRFPKSAAELDLNSYKVRFESISAKYGGLFEYSSFAATFQLLGDLPETTQDKLLIIFEKLLDNLSTLLGECLFRILKNYFSDFGRDSGAVIFQFIIDFTNSEMNTNELQTAVAEKEPSDSVNENDNIKYVDRFAKIIEGYVIGGFVDMYVSDKIIQHSLRLIIETLYVHCETLAQQKRREKNTTRNPHKILCKECGGYYFYKKPL